MNTKKESQTNNPLSSHSYNLYISNSPYKLIEHFSKHFSPQNLFSQGQIIVVQNNNVAHWLKIALTDYFGVTMNLNSMLPDSAIRYLLGFFSNAPNVLYTDEMAMVLETSIRDLPPSHRVSAFVEQSSSSQKSKDIRYYQLAKQLSVLFHHYNQNALDISSTWQQSKRLFSKDQAGDLEAWQNELWLSLFEVNHPFAIIHPQIFDINNIHPNISLPTIHLFGTAFLSAAQINVFHHLSQYTKINQFMWSPLQLEEISNQYSTTYRDSTISNWGKILIDHYHFIKTKKRVNIKAGYISYQDHDILSILKTYILNPKQKTDNTSPPDLSTLRIVGCPGKKREIEVLKNEIISLMEKDPSLLLNQIGVMAVEIEEYRALIDSLFSESNEHSEITYNIVDINYNTNLPLTNGFKQILDLSESDFHVDKLEVLLKNPLVLNKLGLSIDSINEVIHIIKKLNIIWGIDEAHRKSLHQGDGYHNTWIQGIDRIILGHYYKKEENHPFLYFSKDNETFTRNFAKSFSIKDKELEENVISVLTYVYDLYLDISILPSLSLSMSAWVDFTKSLIHNYFKHDQSDLSPKYLMEEKRLFSSFAQLIEMAKVAKNPDLSYQRFKVHWEEQVEKKSSGKGSYLTQGITFSSLKPMRSIPFKHIFLLGMNEKDFPKESIRSELDLSLFLSSHHINKGLAYNPFYIELFSFLETIFSAQKSLHIFYNNRDILNNNKLHPSNLVSDLIELISKCLSIPTDILWKQLSVSHPLQAFDPSYFKKDALKNFSSSHYQAAISSLKQENVAIETQQTIKIQKDNISFKELFDLFNRPAGTFMRYGTEFFIHKTPKELYQKESVDIPFFDFLDYIQNYPESNMSFEHFINFKHDTGYLINNHFDLSNRKLYQQHVQEMIQLFQKKNLLNKKKIRLNLIHKKQQIQSNPSFVYCPPFKLKSFSNAINLYGQINYYEGNYILTQGKKEQSSDESCFIHAYLQALLISYSKSTQKLKKEEIFHLFAFNPFWDNKLKNKQITLHPDESKIILEGSINLFFSHLSNPMPLYLKPIWGELKKLHQQYHTHHSFDTPDKEQIEEKIKTYLTNKNNQEVHLYPYLFKNYILDELPWKDILFFTQKIMETTK